MSTKAGFDFISYEELTNAIENDNGSNRLKVIASHLLNSINDWPTFNLKEPIDFISELKREIKRGLTFCNIEKYAKGLSMNTDTWKIEAISQLLQMFDFNEKDNQEETHLEIIVERITKHYKESNK